MRYGNVYKILILLFGIGFLALIYIRLFGAEDLNNNQPIQYTQEDLQRTELETMWNLWNQSQNRKAKM